jgi:hypothetical protein
MSEDCPGIWTKVIQRSISDRARCTATILSYRDFVPWRFSDAGAHGEIVTAGVRKPAQRRGRTLMKITISRKLGWSRCSPSVARPLI